MKHLGAVALVLGVMTGSVCAQRGSAHAGSAGSHAGFSGGGFSGRAASGVHGGFSAPAPRGFAGSSARVAGRPYLAPRGMQRSSAGADIRARNTGGSWRYRRPYGAHYRPVYGYGVGGWAAPYYLGDPGYGYDSGDSGDQQAAQSASLPANDEQQQPPYSSYFSYPQSPIAQAAPKDEEAVTLIFKDGRPAEQIRNFILTPGTLYVGGEYRREISVDDIDLAATASVNRELGVEFQLPATSR